MHRYASFFLILLIAVLAGCNFNIDDSSPSPTPGTPVAWATAWTPTITPMATATAFASPEPLVSPVSEASVTPAASETPAPSATPTSTPFDLVTPLATATPEATALPAMQVFTPTPPPSFTPAPSLTPVPYVPPTQTPVQAPVMQPTQVAVVPTQAPPAIVPSVTPLPYFPALTAAPVVTAAPTLTPMVISPTPMPAVTGVVAPTYTPIYMQPPTFTPAPIITLPTSAPAAAVVCASCGNLRLRDTPGSAGSIVASLDALTPVTIIGRTQDSSWVQIVMVSGLSGWVASQYLDITIDLAAVAVTGNAVMQPTAVSEVVVPPPTNIISGVSAHARQIYLNGRAMGVRGNVFSKVGDSITVAPYFLHQLVDVYNLADYGYLAPALSFFYGPDATGGNPFSRNSLAAGNGWSTASVLDPGAAAPGICQAGETPLECEYRVAKPAVAIIMLGTNDSGGLPIESYRANLQRIIDISISRGVIPVLTTIPPMRYEAARDARIGDYNSVIVALARGNDIPLINYWSAMNALPNQGLAPDGVHPNGHPSAFNAHFTADHLQYGYPVRNLVTLQMLYELWRQVLYDGGTYVENPVVQPPAVVPTAAPADGSNIPTAPVDPATYSCPGTLPVRLTVGSQGRVTPGLPNKMRATPSMSAGTVGSIPGEATFLVAGGPVCADGYTWWQVTYEGVTGWTAQGDASEYWVEPLIP